MDKRTFLKRSALLGVGGAIAGSLPGSLKAAGLTSAGRPAGESYKLPELDYAFDALEPYIDAMTMEIHHDRHHAGYTKNFNAAVLEAGLSDTGIKEIFRQVSKYPAAIRNNGGGYWNHKMYWKCMSPNGGGEPAGDLQKALEKSFGSFENFREQMSKTAATQFGSGWAWLVSTADGLVVTSTPNQDNPLMDVAGVQGFPLLCIDVWEHAYYLKHQNMRTDYIEAFWHVVNWDYVSGKYAKAMK
jgi:Fe-Mn family superoxide dismutase